MERRTSRFGRTQQAEGHNVGRKVYRPSVWRHVREGNPEQPRRNGHPVGGTRTESPDFVAGAYSVCTTRWREGEEGEVG